MERNRKCQCGAVVSSEEAVFCPECGNRLAETPAQTEVVSNGAPEEQPAAQPDDEAAQGAQQPDRQPRCEACGRAWNEQYQFCPECGEQAGSGQETAKLVIHTPDGDKKEARLDGSTVLIGKEAGATVKLDDRYVSRDHCRFVPTDSGEYQVEDLDSHNGTFLKITEPVSVRPGSTFLVGNCLICVEKE